MIAAQLSAPQTAVDPSLPLVVQGVAKAFAGVPALVDIDLSLASHRVVALLGPSGCGKTTLLRCIAGLHDPDAGSIHLAGRLAFRGRTSLPPESRSLGMVFQDYALWPHLSVAQNIGYPLKMRSVATSERRRRVDEALELVGLQGLGDRSPGTLSGGQQQRVALARAVVARPTLLLMDEPLSNLDKGLRESLAMDIRALISDLGLAAVFVTHDQQEAFALADVVAVMHAGRIRQLAPPQTIYRDPLDPQVAAFIDNGPLLSGSFATQGFFPEGSATALPIHADQHGPATLLIPRYAVSLDGDGSIAGKISAEIFRGEDYALRVTLDCGTRIRFAAPSAPPPGARVRLRLHHQHLRAWNASAEALSLTPTPGEHP